MAHRLAVHDSIKSLTACNHFEIFISKLYSLFDQSHKLARLLEEVADELNVQILRIGEIFTIRWVCISFNTVCTLLWLDIFKLKVKILATLIK